MGSKCYVIKSGTWYILNGNGDWVPFVDKGGSVNAEVILAIIDEMSDSEKSQLKSELDITSIFTFKGIVNEEDDLPLNNNSVGDVYHVIENSSEYVWIITNNIGDFEIGKWEMLGNDFIEITPTNIITATEQMTATQKATTRENIGAGTYSKPNDGIPKSDLTLTIQTSLDKANTALQTAPVASVNGKTGAVVLDANDVGALPNDTPIPAAVTEQTVSNWGFTKNTGTYNKPVGGIPDSDIASAETWNAKGTYSKPSGGIPKSDLASAVQTSLGKADTALQSVPNTYRTAAAQDLIDEAQDARINQKADASALAKVATTGSYNDLSNKPTIPSLNGYATETWVTEKGYQTATQVQTAISNVRQLPVVSTSDNGKFLRVISGAWAAAIVPSAETTSF